MKKILRSTIAILVVTLCGFLGFWLERDVQQSVQRPVREPTPPHTTRKIMSAPEKSIAPNEPKIVRNGVTVEVMASSRENEAILRFPSPASYEAFLASLPGSGVSLVDQLDRLHAMRLGFAIVTDLEKLLNEDNIEIYNSVSRVPNRMLPGTGVQEGSVGFNEKVISWLGIMGDLSKLGSGVKVAVLDTGIVPHEALPGLVKSIAIEPFPANLENTNGHGTAVASLIAGNSSIAPGVAPATSLISVRVCNDNGTSDSFSIAAGMLAAMDAGAHIINLSMGTYEDSPLMAAAVAMVADRGIVIVAASGNDGQDDAAYPAAYPGVISVGAVDAQGNQLKFSNFGSYLSITAPGYQVNAAWPGNRYVRLSGTSVSAPLVAGAIAATMSQGTGISMTATDAARLVMDYTDDAGLPGSDSQYGTGILNLSRVLFRNTPRLVDAAITDQRIVANNQGGGELQVTVQNRGTAVLVNTMVEIITQLGIKKLNVTTLPVRGIHTFTMPIPTGSLSQSQQFRVSTRMILGNSGTDIIPANNQRTDSFPPN